MARAFDTFIAPTLKKLPAWITPNRVTIVRAFIMPLVVATQAHPVIATTLFVIGCLLDALDGALARVRGPITKLGQWLDPLVDKTHVHGTLWFACRNDVGLIICLIVSGIDTALTITRFFKERKGVGTQSNKWGGLKMWTQSFAISFVLTRSAPFEPLVLPTFILAIALAYASFVGHLYDFRRRPSI